VRVESSPGRSLLDALIQRSVRRLAARGIETAALDTELLMAAACGVSRVALLRDRNEPTRDAIRRFSDMIARRECYEPVAYILGSREFYSLDLVVTPAVLVPRPETEILVDMALTFARIAKPRSILDLGTGSGCIAVALAANLSVPRIVATDVSQQALDVAAVNVQRLGFCDRIELRQSDLFERLQGERFDMILSNPPYVERDAALPLEVANWEPKDALFAGDDGLLIHRRIAVSVREHLNPGGIVAVEVGAGQAESVEAFYRSAGAAAVEIVNDLAGIQRVVTAHFQ
jgi:release factor glutamine methyltransferase